MLTATELDDLLDAPDGLVGSCIQGELPFREFEQLYGDFYVHHALDGHESDEAERDLLDSRAARIALHADIFELILCKVTSDDFAANPDYESRGFIGSDRALTLLSELAVKHGLVCA